MPRFVPGVSEPATAWARRSMSQTLRLTATVVPDGDWFVARCVEVEVASPRAEHRGDPGQPPGSARALRRGRACPWGASRTHRCAELIFADDSSLPGLCAGRPNRLTVIWRRDVVSLLAPVMWTG